MGKILRPNRKTGSYINCLRCNNECYVIKARINTFKYCSYACLNYKGIRKNTGRTHFKKGAVAEENNSQWKGDKASYSAIHHWVKRKLGKPLYCVTCGKREGRFEWANISREYKRDLTDFMPLCYSCHDKYDDARKKMWITRRNYV